MYLCDFYLSLSLCSALPLSLCTCGGQDATPPLAPASAAGAAPGDLFGKRLSRAPQQGSLSGGAAVDTGASTDELQAKLKRMNARIEAGDARACLSHASHAEGCVATFT
jgi:hypothetical protein